MYLSTVFPSNLSKLFLATQTQSQVESHQQSKVRLDITTAYTKILKATLAHLRRRRSPRRPGHEDWLSEAPYRCHIARPYQQQEVEIRDPPSPSSTYNIIETTYRRPFYLSVNSSTPQHQHSSSASHNISRSFTQQSTIDAHHAQASPLNLIMLFSRISSHHISIA